MKESSISVGRVVMVGALMIGLGVGQSGATSFGPCYTRCFVRCLLHLDSTVKCSTECLIKCIPSSSPSSPPHSCKLGCAPKSCSNISTKRNPGIQIFSSHGQFPTWDFAGAAMVEMCVKSCPATCSSHNDSSSPMD